MRTVSLFTCAAMLAATGLAAQKPAFECSARVQYSKLWTHLHARYDADHNGRITKDEYPRGDVRFDNYDRNGDGILNVEDFPAGKFFNGFNPMLARRADADSDKAVTRAEWQAFTQAFDSDEDGAPDRDGVAAAMRGWGIETDKDWQLFLLSFDQNGDGRFTQQDLALVFADMDADGDGSLTGNELRGHRPTAERPGAPLPKVGDPAPDFELPRVDDPKRSIRLSSFRGKKPVALVFGSYT